MHQFTTSSAIEISGQFHQVAYSRPSAAGYFAPRRAQLVETGAYLEFEAPGPTLVALDLGVGMQRVAEHGAGAGPWRRAFRLYALVALRLRPGRDLTLELDGYESQLTRQVATTPGWRYGSAALSLRWALP